MTSSRWSSRAIRGTVVLLLLVSALVIGSGATRTWAQETTDQPDIFVIVLDDLGYIPDQRVLERLPAIDSMFIEGGRRFSSAYGETPLCCPGRAGLLTGQHTLHHGVTHNDGDLLDPRTTVAVALDDAGYHTIFGGKYFKHYQGTRTPPGWDHILMRRNSRTYFVDGEKVNYRGQFDEQLRRHVVEWLRAAPEDEPVLSWLTPLAPHACPGTEAEPCYEPPVMRRDRDATECAGIADYEPPAYRTRTNRREVFPMPPWPDGWRLGTTCESLLVVDRMIAELTEVQQARGRPAWFVLVSDNGMSYGRKGFTFKRNPYATQVPLYVKGPGTPTGSTEGALVSTIDLAPTLAELGGTSMPAADGMSFRAALFGEPFSGREELLEHQPSEAVDGYEGFSAIRTSEWRLLRWDSGRRELYDLVADPWETNDVAAEQPDIVARLDESLDTLVSESRG